MYLKELANRETEIRNILEDYKNTHQNCLEADDLDEVIDKIDEIQSEKNVALCRNLDKALIKFKNNVLGKIDQFEGQIYDSSMIPIVTKIQLIFRERMKARMIKKAKDTEEAKSKFKRSGMIAEKKMSKLHLVNGIEDEDYEYMTYLNYVNTKNSL